MKKNNYNLFVLVFLFSIIITSQHFYHSTYARSLVANSLYKVACLPIELIQNRKNRSVLPNAHISHNCEHNGKKYVCYFAFKQSPPLCQPKQKESIFKKSNIYPSIVHGNNCFFPDDTHKTVLKILESHAKLEDFGGIIAKDWQEARELLKDD